MTVAARSREAQARELIEAVHADLGDLRAVSPLLFGPGAPGRLLSVVEDGAVRAACAVLPRELRLGRSALRVGLVGTVSTHPAHRGRGLGTELLRAAERELRAEGCALGLLWADDPAFYERRGWAPAGTEVDVVLEPDLAPALPAPTDVRPLRAGDVQAVHALYRAHADRLDRRPAETACLLRCPDMDVLVRAAGERVRAYACVGRGPDLFGVVHEWGGAPADVLALLRALLEREGSGRAPGERLFLMLPAAAVELRERLVALGALAVPGVLGMSKVLDAAAVAELAGRAARRAPDLRLETCGGTTLLTGPRGACALDERELLALACAARGTRDLHRDLEGELGVDLAGLPLAPFVWGLDSI